MANDTGGSLFGGGSSGSSLALATVIIDSEMGKAVDGLHKSCSWFLVSAGWRKLVFPFRGWRGKRMVGK